MAYNWQYVNWPDFTYNLLQVEEKLYAFSQQTGMVGGILKSLPDDTQLDAIVEIMVAEAVKTSEIEGEFLSRKDVMSSIKKDLGLKPENNTIADKRSEGVGQLMVSVRETYKTVLSEEQLFGWHRMLLGMERNLTVGAWRFLAEPMQVISGAVGKTKVHFEAPPSSRVPQEMARFIKWFNDTAPGGINPISKAPVRCAIAHLYFESIHPFEDGNGRIGRCIAEKALSQGLGRPALLSLSGAIELNRKRYYTELEAAQQTVEITPWVTYFVDVIMAAQEHAELLIDFALKKTKFFDKHKDELSDRQLKVVRRMLEEGPKGFDGGMNAGKYGTITKVAKATATRDLQDLLEKGVFILLGTAGGRSTKYQLNI